jgi:hypothetical protein
MRVFWSCLAAGLIGITTIVSWHLLSGKATPSLQTFPTRLDVELRDEPTVYSFTVGGRQVIVQLERGPTADDNGPVDITVAVDGHTQTTLRSYYDYDLWSDIEPASYHWAWRDEDLQRDLVITENTRWGNGQIIVLSQDGQVFIGTSDGSSDDTD